MLVGVSEATAGFEFATAARIVFGAGRVAELASLALGFGRRVLLVHGKDARRHAGLRASLEAQGLVLETYAVAGEPTTEDARHAAELGRRFRAELVIGIGGGSPLDLGKAAAALITNGGDPLDYLEVIGKGKKITRAALPYIAVPTTAGTGSEVTKNAVLESPEHRVKVSLRGDQLLPRIALVDSELTLGAPPDLTAHTGLDALAQVIEPFVSNRSNPLTDALCRDAIPRIARALPRAYRDGRDRGARDDLALGSLFGGLALANAKLGSVHGFAGPLGGMFQAPHGALCARLLAPALRVNLSALAARAPQHPARARYDEIARMLSGDLAARAEDAAHFLDALCESLAVPGISTYGVTRADAAQVIDKARNASSMQGNPIVLTEAELTAVFFGAL